MQLLRTWMFVPGHRQKMVDKALKLGQGATILDLEDGVPATEKALAREGIAAALGQGGNKAVYFVRIHQCGSREMAADLDAVVRPGLDGLVLAKVEGVDDVLQVDAKLRQLEKAGGLQQGHVQLLATIESARGLTQAPNIAGACPRLMGLMFGAEDFALDLGLFAGSAGDLLYARSALVVAAASQQLQAVDRVCPDFRDSEGLQQDALQARQIGFTGKALIHPSQIEIVDQVFHPTEAEIEWARRVVQAFEEAEAVGQGAVAVDGQMVDLPVVERARRLLATHFPT